MFLGILFLPLLGFFCTGAFGKYFGKIGSNWLATSCVFLTFLFSVVAYYEVISVTAVQFTLFK